MKPSRHTFDEPDMPMLAISDAAKALGISVNMLRLYEAQGLVVPARTSKNQRRYSRSDLARLACIRQAIHEEQMTIAAIKRIMALAPCWEIVKCSEEDREHCDAYRGHDRPCWSYHHTNNVCATLECRLCEVYQMAGDCSQIKELIVRATKKSNGKE